MLQVDKFAQLVGLNYVPDDAQTSVITHPFIEPLLVLAGAGAGKTETMTNRIAYMVASNVTIESDQILGVTFTNKAATELRERVYQRIKNLRAAQKRNNDDMTMPEISTYNAFATQIVQDYGMLEGIETDSRVITEADRYLLMKQAVRELLADDAASGDGLDKAEVDDSIADLDINVDSLVTRLVNFSDQVDNNLLTLEEIERFDNECLNKFLPDEWVTKRRNTKEWKNAGVSYASTDKNQIRDTLLTRNSFLRYIEKFQELKRQRNVIDFADQIKYAMQIVQNQSSVRADIRKRYKYVILDEYQDTSASQVKLLQIAFGEHHPVVAVGDPNQAIYEWRGASSGSIFQFVDYFTPENGSTKTVELTTSRRNSPQILQVANLITKPLVDKNGKRMVSELKSDTLRDKRLAANGIEPCVKINLCAAQQEDMAKNSQKNVQKEGSQEKNSQFVTFEEKENQLSNLLALGFETEKVVEFLRKHFKDWNEAHSQNLRTAAILTPVRKDFTIYRHALSAAGIKVQVNGLGGLLELPEIQDILAYLYVANSNESDDKFLRILTSPRFNFSSHDLQNLRALTKSLQNTSPKNADKTSEVIGLVDFVKKLPRAAKLQADTKKKMPDRFLKLHTLSELLHEFNQFTTLPLDEYVEKIIELIGIEHELQIIESIETETDAASENSIHTFKNQVRNFAQTAEDATLSSLLNYFEIVLQTENGFDQPIGKIDSGAVQLITIFGAKGLEWDVVCSVSNNLKGFLHSNVAPYTKPKNKSQGFAGALVDYPNYIPKFSGSHLVKPEIIPDNLRLDAKSLEPLTDLTQIADLMDYDMQLSRYENAGSIRHMNERRRLAYVAFTRPRTHLLVTASLFNKDVSIPTLPTPFFIDIAPSAKGVLDSIFEPIPWVGNGEKSQNLNPLQNVRRQRMLWPNYSAAYKKSAYWQANTRVAKKLAAIPALDGFEDENLSLLLQEREQILQRLKNPLAGTSLPRNISTSGLVKMTENYNEFLKDALRPIPDQPKISNTKGTRFHNFVQHFYQSDDVQKHLANTYIYQTDEMNSEETIDVFVTNFLNSPWSKMIPLEVEREVKFLLHGHLVVARIDAIFADPRDKSKAIIVDWKTGVMPHSDRDAQIKAVQLAQYAHAFALTTDKKQLVDAAFVYVANPDNEKNVWRFTGEALQSIYRSTEKIITSNMRKL